MGGGNSWCKSPKFLMVCWMFDFESLKSVLLEYPHDVIDFFSIMYNRLMQPYYSRLALWVQLINLDQSFIEATSSSIMMRVDCNMLGGPEKEEKEAFSWMSNAHLTNPEELSVRPMGHCRHIMQTSFFLCEIPYCHNVCVSPSFSGNNADCCVRLSQCYGYSKQGFWTTTADTQ